MRPAPKERTFQYPVKPWFDDKMRFSDESEREQGVIDEW